MSRRPEKPSSNSGNSEVEDENTSETSLIKTEFPSNEELNVAEIVLSNKGGPKVIHNGYMYTLHKKQPHNIRWRCVGRTLHCRGSLITTTDCKKPRVRMEHNHNPDYAAVQLARKRYIALGQPRILPEDEEAMMRLPHSSNRNHSDFLTLSDWQPQPQSQAEPRPQARAQPQPQPQSPRRPQPTPQRQVRPILQKNTETASDRQNRAVFGPKNRQAKRYSGGTGGSKFATISGQRVRLTKTMKQEPEDDEDCLLEAGSLVRPLTPGLSSSRVRSHARSLRAMANPSAVWAHFDLCTNDPLRAQCRICGAVVVRGGANPRQCGTTNLHRHLRVHHGGRLIGRRYHVLPAPPQAGSSGKTIRIAGQSLIRPQIRNIAPAPTPGQQQHQQQPKTLVLKTIPLKVKQVAPTTIKMPSRQLPQSSPQTVPQQPTEVCLRWNSYHSNMQNSFPSLLDAEQFVDVTLACEGRSLKCHKMILSSCSDYLAELLRENPCQHPIILMKDLKFWEVEALVKFMYRGEVNVAHDKLPQLLNAAEALQVKGLAGPSPSSQNAKPPMLIPQLKPAASHPIISRVTSEAKEIKSPVSNVTIPSSPKRGQKRRPSESAEPKTFTKIRLQRPATPVSPSPAVKLEPLDIPLSPTEMFADNNEDCATSSNFGNLLGLHEDEDPGGDEEPSSVDGELNFCELPGPSGLNDAEDQMEFVPTDFLEQEQDILEEQESDPNGKEEPQDHSHGEDDDYDAEGREEFSKKDNLT